jgi:hypothetical protein
MKRLIASVVAAAFIGTPALAASTAPAAKSTKTIVTKGPKATATTTVTTKVAPTKKVASRHRAKNRKVAMSKAKKPAAAPAQKKS